MIRKLLPHPILSLTLWAIWLLLNNSFEKTDIVFGFILGLLIPLASARFWEEKVCMKKPLTLIKLIFVVAYDILASNIIVAYLVLSPNSKLKPSFLIVDLDIQSPLGISLLANTISLAPGTLTCDVTQDRKQLILHTLHTDNVEQAIADIKRRYEKPLMEIFTQC